MSGLSICSCMVQGRAKQLVSTGITSPQQLAAADPKSLCEMIDHLYLKQAKRMVRSAKVHTSTVETSHGSYMYFSITRATIQFLKLCTTATKVLHGVLKGDLTNHTLDSLT